VFGIPPPVSPRDFDQLDPSSDDLFRLLSVVRAVLFPALALTAFLFFSSLVAS